MGTISGGAGDPCRRATCLPGARSGRVSTHRYTRTQLLFEDFTRSFNDADEVWVADVYAAGESPIEGATSDKLATAIAEHGHHAVRHLRDRTAIIHELAAKARPGDVVIALGAGDINRILPEIAELIGKRSSGSTDGSSSSA